MSRCPAINILNFRLFLTQSYWWFQRT